MGVAEGALARAHLVDGSSSRQPLHDPGQYMSKGHLDCWLIVFPCACQGPRGWDGPHPIVS